MTDRFLTEVRRLHDLRRHVRSLTDEQLDAFMGLAGDDAAEEWVFQARDAQLPPKDCGWLWLFLGGRGTGKSRSMSAAMHLAVRSGIKRIHLIAPTTADVHDVNLEGPAGIFATCGNDPRPRFVTSKRRLEWPNGAIATVFSGEEPESLRGPQCELVVMDEIGRMRYQQQVFDMAMMGLRLGDLPRMLIATTPRVTPFMKKLIRMDGISMTTGSTYDNAAHLAPSFIQKIKELYEGTRLGRQELNGAMILDPENALFKDDWLVHDEIDEKLIEQVTIGVDPSGGADEVGIIAAALLNDRRYGILADRTVSGSPAAWGDAVVKAYDDFDADDCVVERNFGGDMATEVIKQAADRAAQLGKRPDNMIRVREVVASRGKVMRAEPISLLYEKGRVVHRRGLDQYEGEMMSFSREWDRAVDGSPNRLDAGIWALSRLAKVVLDIPVV